MREVAPANRRELVPLFARHETLRAVVDSVLEGSLGRARASTRTPGAARLSLGCYEIFGGAPEPEAARELIEGVAAPKELVFGNDPEWRRILVAIFGDRISDRPMKSYLAGPIPGGEPAGEGDGDEPVAIDARFAERLDAELAPHALQVFESARDFEERGAGFAILSEGEIASAATTYAVGAGSIEVAVATRPRFRGRGLAFGVARRLLREAERLGLAAHWNASNPISQRLALRLGMRPRGLCEVLLLS